MCYKYIFQNKSMVSSGNAGDDCQITETEREVKLILLQVVPPAEDILVLEALVIKGVFDMNIFS